MFVNTEPVKSVRMMIVVVSPSANDENDTDKYDLILIRAIVITI